MAGWSSLGSVEDHRLAQSLLDGAPGAIAEIYDFYAPRLYDYCHALLRDQDLAADSLHDSLIATREHIAKLREPEHFRSWAYAIVRNQCLRLLADPNLRENRQPAPEMDDDTLLDTAERQRREETRQLVQSALAGLTGPEREALDLCDRHDLSVEELSGVLGMPTPEATELVRRAHDGLDNTLAAALISRTGRDACPSVAALSDGKGWPLPPEVCRRLVRHIESCPTCREHPQRHVSGTRLMRVLPIATVPGDLRTAVLSLAEAPDGAERRTAIAQRAEPFDISGWPAVADTARREEKKRPGTPKLLPVIGAAAGVIVLVGGVFMLMRGSSAASHDTRSPALAAPNDPLSGAPFPSQSASSPTPTASSPSPKLTTHSPTPAATAERARSTPKPSRKTSKAPTPPQGTLAVSGCSMAVGQAQCTVTIAARGGSVSWKVTGTSGVTATPTSGQLATGGTAQVIVTRSVTCTKDGTGSVTFTPGGSAQVSWSCVLGGL